MDWVLGAKLAQQGSITVILSIYRPFRIDDFDRNHIAVWRTFMPHLQRALQLQLRLASLEANCTTSLEVLNRLRQGMLLVDVAARVVFANRAAEMMFTEGNGLRIDVDGLHAASPAATATLRKLIAECAQDNEDPKGSGGAIALPRGTRRIPLNGFVIPLRATTGWLHFNRPTSIIFITDPERQHVVREAHLRRQFDLTKAEAAFVVEILRGEGLQASADRLGIALSTARTHLSHVFDKTGTNRQAELVRFILQGQAAIYDE